MKKTYMETRKAIKELVLTVGLNGITGYHIVDLYNGGHNSTNVQNAISNIRYSPATTKYRMRG